MKDLVGGAEICFGQLHLLTETIKYTGSTGMNRPPVYVALPFRHLLGDRRQHGAVPVAVVRAGLARVARRGQAALR